MNIVPMNEHHVPQIALLERECFADPWSEQSIASELHNPLSLWLVAQEGQTLLGYVGSQTCQDETDMMNIAVSPASRRQGVARALIEALVSALRQRGSKQLTLEVRASNGPARQLYESLGFLQVGLRKNYYRNPKEDALILRKEWTL
mgnify:FL=1